MIIAGEAIEEIKKDYNLTQKLESAFIKGSIASIESAINNPLVSFVLTSLRDLQRTGNF